MCFFIRNLLNGLKFWLAYMVPLGYLKLKREGYKEGETDRTSINVKLKFILENQVVLIV